MPTLVAIDKVGWGAHQLRLWSYLNFRQDVFWPIDQWPAWAQRAITLSHKNDSLMFNLAVFFLVNGLSEATTFLWICSRDFRNNHLVEGPYSQKEKSDMARVLHRWRRGQLPLQGKKVFDMISGRPVDAGEYQQGAGREEVGNREITTISLGGDFDWSVIQQPRSPSDAWIE